MKVYRLVRVKTGKPMDSKVYKSKADAEKQMRWANKEFREFNAWLKKTGRKRKPVGLVKVKQESFSRRKNVGW
jgi:hypothetical protein